MRLITRLAVALCVVISFALVACSHKESGVPPATSAIQTSSDAAGAEPSKAAAASGSMVKLKGTLGETNGYLALPQGTGKHPAIVVIQEWWGMDDWLKEQTDRLAKSGYVALAVDLYRGHTTNDPGEAHELMRGLSEDRALADLKAGVDFLAARPEVDPSRIGAIGWCMGGGYAVSLAVAEPRLVAVAVNYGHLVSDPAQIDKIKAAFLGNFAGADRGISPDDVRKFETEMRNRKKDVDIKIYEAKAHAFMNPNNKQGYDKGAADDAWARIEAFFQKKLGNS